MVQMARVVADLVHVGRHGGGQPVVLLEVHHQVRAGLAPDLGQGFHVLGAVHGHADEVAAGLADGLCLLDGGVDVLRSGGAHALHGYAVSRADESAADAHGSRRITFGCHTSILRETRDGAKADRLLTGGPRDKPLYLPFSVATPADPLPAVASPAWPRSPPRPTSRDTHAAAQGRRHHSPARPDGREHARIVFVRVDQGRSCRAARCGGSRRCPRAGSPSCRVFDRLLVEVEGPRVEVRVFDGVEQVEVLRSLPLRHLGAGRTDGAR